MSERARRQAAADFYTYLLTLPWRSELRGKVSQADSLKVQAIINRVLMPRLQAEQQWLGAHAR